MKNKWIDLLSLFIKNFIFMFLAINSIRVISYLITVYIKKAQIYNMTSYFDFSFPLTFSLTWGLVYGFRFRTISLKLNMRDSDKNDTLEIIRKFLLKMKWKIERQSAEEIVFKSSLVHSPIIHRIVLNLSDEEPFLYGPKHYVEQISDKLGI